MRNNRKTVATKRKWHNSATLATPSGVASAFIHSNFAPSEAAVLQNVLDQFGEDPKKAKALCEELGGTEFGSAVEYARYAQFQAYFLKSTIRGGQDKRRECALEKFRAAEKRCKITNRRLRYFGAHWERENPVYRVVLTRARQLISRVLGNLSENLLEHLIALSQPGGGVCIGTRSREDITLPHKLAATDLCCTQECLPFARRLVEGSPAWFRLVAEVDWGSKSYSVPYVLTRANRIVTVPKDAVTDRTIAIEPHLNVCLQLGVHEYVRRRLLGVGIDITKQEFNQRCAFAGSLCWRSVNPLVTLDLSAASDSVSVALCERLLPSDWLAYLGALRSESYSLDGAVFDYEKWSSMGNGYTFVLETLLFWAIASACTSFTDPREGVSVYGDDIIVRRNSAAFVIEVLRYCGFQLNTEKSFLFGPFRESCGMDVFDGVCVTPTYIRGRSSLRPTDIYRVLNRSSTWFTMSEVRAYLLRCHSLTGPVLRGLENEDDTSCLFTDLSTLRSMKRVKWNPHWQAWTFLAAHFRVRGKSVPVPWVVASTLLGFRPKTHGKSDTTVKRKGSWTLIRRTAGRKASLGA